LICSLSSVVRYREKLSFWPSFSRISSPTADRVARAAAMA